MSNKNIDGGTMNKKTYINIENIKFYGYFMNGFYGVVVNGKTYKNQDTYELLNDLHRNNIVVKGYER